MVLTARDLVDVRRYCGFAELLVRDGSYDEIRKRIKKESPRFQPAGSQSSTTFYSAVQSVDLIEDAMYAVYDMQTETHSFIANGIVVHNCGEQPLGPYENCCLGHVNLAAHFDEENAKMDWQALQETISMLTVFLDNTIDANKYVPSVPMLEKMAKLTRKVGIGFAGLADVLMMSGITYGSDESLDFISEFSERLRYTAMKTSVELAKTRGPFENYANSEWAPGRIEGHPFYKKVMKRSGKNCRYGCDWHALFEEMAKYGIRNSCLLTVAPTGTTGNVLGVEGGGCEPVFMLSYNRRVNDGSTLTYVSRIVEKELNRLSLLGKMTDEERTYIVDRIKKTGEGPATFDGWSPILRAAFDSVSSRIEPIRHIKIQAALQEWVDSSISKTINCPFSTTKDAVY